MNIDRLADILIEEEGYRAHAYTCTSGAVTVAVGRNIDAEHGGLGISESEARFLLANDIDRCIDECERAFDWFEYLDDSRQAVIVHLAFWIGLPRLMKFKKMIAAIEEENFQTAALELLDSKLARDIPGRATRLADELRGSI